ncbi:MAG: GAF domain-containing protein [Candidatus Binatia bacterium]
MPRRKRGEEKIQSQMQRLAVLGEIILAVTSSLDLRSVLEVLLEKIDLFLPYPAACVRLLNKETGELKRMACRNLNEQEWKGRKQEIGRLPSYRVLQNMAPLIIPNVQTDLRTYDPDFFRKHGLKSWLGVPLLAKGEVLGVLSFYTRVEHEFSNEEVDFLITLANHAAVAIHNSQLYERIKKQEAENAEALAQVRRKTFQLQRANQQLSALYTMAATATGSLDLDTVLQEVVKKITEVFHFDATQIFLFDPQMDELHVRASFEARPELWAGARVFRRGQGIVGRVGESGEPIILEDALSDPRYQELSHSKAAQKAAYRFLGVFSIKTKERTVGVIVCIGQDPRRLTRDEIQLITSMADHIGVAVENASLFEETRSRASELSALYSVASVVNQSLDIDSVLRSVMQEVLEIFKFDAGRVYVHDSESNDLRLLAHQGFPEGAPPVKSCLPGVLVRKVYETGNPLLFEDIQNNPEIDQMRTTKVLARAGYRGSFIMPVNVKGKTVGVINFVSKAAHKFSPGEIQLISSIANYVGVAVENAQLYEQTKNQAAWLEKENAERRRAEEQVRRHKEELEELVQERTVKIQELERRRAEGEKLAATGRMAARIAHEINNPLAGIKNSFLLIKDAVNEDHPYYQYVDRIDKEIARIARIVRQMFYLYRPDQESAREFLVDEAIGDVVALLEVSARQRDVVMELETDDASLLETMPEDLLRQVLYNIIQNAIEASPEGGVVKIAAAIREDVLTITVSDRGNGIPEEVRSRIFEPFFSTKAYFAQAGLGLGLSVSKSMVEAMGGTLDFESNLGEGTVFRIILPLGGGAKRKSAWLS